MKIGSAIRLWKVCFHADSDWLAGAFEEHREHLRAVANAGAPDLAGIRSEPRAASRNKPVGYFRTRSDPWQPPVAGEAKAVRVLIRAAANS